MLSTNTIIQNSMELAKFIFTMFAQRTVFLEWEASLWEGTVKILNITTGRKYWGEEKEKEGECQQL